MPALVNELDWPSKSYASGWDSNIQDKSLYLQMRNVNKCVHRQFQNVAHNGAEMKNFVEQLGEAHFDNTGAMKPVFVSAAYIGNDVCKDTLAEMTNTDGLFCHNVLTFFQ